MNEFLDLLMERNDPALNDKLRASTVGIAGCGGLGSNVAVALARIGVGKLVLADFDKVQPSNLNRQQFTVDDIGSFKTEALANGIHQFNPCIDLEPVCVKLDAANVFDVFRDCRVVVEAFDTAEGKSMLIQSFADDRFKNKYLITASGLAGAHSSNLIETRKLARNIFICGDFVNAPDEAHGLMAPRVMIAAGHEANMVVRIISGVLAP